MPNKSPWEAIGNIILECLESPAAKRIGKRLETLSRASFIPATGHGNFNAAAALMDMTERGMEEMIARRGLPVTKPGNERIIRFADIIKTFEETATPPKAKRPAKRK